MDKENSNSNQNSSKLSDKNFSIKSDKDLIEIRDYGRKLAAEIGFAGNDQTLIATALSEICRNVIEYAGSGEVTISTGRENPKGIEIIVTDSGPGIENIALALQEGYSTGKGLGIGLPGAKRIMDRFDIQSEVGVGTTIKMIKRLDSYDF